MRRDLLPGRRRIDGGHPRRFLRPATGEQPTQVGGFLPAATTRADVVVPLRQSTPDWTSMCWLPIPGRDPWRLCILRTAHDKTCLPAPPATR
jgi:hypothetical protein